MSDKWKETPTVNAPRLHRELPKQRQYPSSQIRHICGQNKQFIVSHLVFGWLWEGSNGSAKNSPCWVKTGDVFDSFFQNWKSFSRHAGWTWSCSISQDCFLMIHVIRVDEWAQRPEYLHVENFPWESAHHFSSKYCVLSPSMTINLTARGCKHLAALHVDRQHVICLKRTPTSDDQIWLRFLAQDGIFVTYLPI